MGEETLREGYSRPPKRKQDGDVKKGYSRPPAHLPLPQKPPPPPPPKRPAVPPKENE